VKLTAQQVIGMLSAACATPAPVIAAATAPGTGLVAPMPGGIGIPDADGRLLGHLPYAEAPPGELTTVTSPGFALGAPRRLQPDAAADLTQLIETANATPEIAHQLKGVSCYRAVARQRAVFCRDGMTGDACRDAVQRARSVGPPGFSEHATGYAIDFGVRPAPGCPDLEQCMAATPAGRWLMAHARDFGFELSFPAGNAQKVTWEPWHWRWVGRSARAAGAMQARQVFARARMRFPARPMIDPPPIQTAHATPAPLVLPIPLVWPSMFLWG
jgi:D-alanyl-D-alanine carboxypeptidase